MRKNALFFMLFLSGGCAQVHPISSTLILKPHIISGSQVQALITPYDKTSIHHLKLDLFPLVDGVTQAKVTGKTLINAQLDNPVVFSNLKANTQYRIQASAYYSTDDTQLISLSASCSQDVSLITDDSPTFVPLKVVLIDRPFNAQATSSLNIVSGGYTPVGSPSFAISPVLNGNVTTFVGVSNDNRYVDGTALEARFNNVQMMAMDTQGDLFVADTSTHTVRKVSPSGIVTTLAGNGSSGFLDGTGTAARFRGTMGLAINPITHDIYVSEYYGHVIRKVTSNGVVTTVAGNGTSGLLDGTGTAARLNQPGSMVFNSQGELVFVDTYNHCIRKLSPQGVVTTIAGNGATGNADLQGANARFYLPLGLTIDSQDNLYCTDFGGHTIRKITPNGTVSTIAGAYLSAGTTNGVGTNARFNSPHGIAINALGDLYVTDYGNALIRKIDPQGVVTTFAGGGAARADGYRTQAGFVGARMPFIAPDGTLYIGDDGCIRRIQ